MNLVKISEKTTASVISFQGTDLFLDVHKMELSINGSCVLTPNRYTQMSPT